MQTHDNSVPLIIFTPEAPRILREAWDAIGNKVGWKFEQRRLNVATGHTNA